MKKSFFLITLTTLLSSLQAAELRLPPRKEEGSPPTLFQIQRDGNWDDIFLNDDLPLSKGRLTPAYRERLERAIVQDEQRLQELQERIAYFQQELEKSVPESPRYESILRQLANAMKSYKYQLKPMIQMKKTLEEDSQASNPDISQEELDLSTLSLKEYLDAFPDMKK